MPSLRIFLFIAISLPGVEASICSSKTQLPTLKEKCTREEPHVSSVFATWTCKKSSKSSNDSASLLLMGSNESPVCVDLSANGFIHSSSRSRFAYSTLSKFISIHLKGTPRLFWRLECKIMTSFFSSNTRSLLGSTCVR